MRQDLLVATIDGTLGFDEMGLPMVRARDTKTVSVETDWSLLDVYAAYSHNAEGSQRTTGMTAVVLIREGLSPRLIFLETVVGSDGALTWFVGLSELRIGDLGSLFPNPIDLSWGTDLVVFCEYPAIGQGFDVDWATLVDAYAAILPILEQGLTVYGAVELANRGRKALAGRVVRGLQVLKGSIPRWRRRNGSPYNIREVLLRADYSVEKKMQLLGLESVADVEALEAVLLPSPDAQDALRSLAAQGDLIADAAARSASLLEMPDPKRLPCACKYGDCQIFGGIVATAHGLKIGLSDDSDHFVIGQDGVHLLMRETVKYLEMGWSGGPPS